MIAQDVEQVFPEVVITDNKTGLKSVAYDHLVAPLIEATKSLYKRLINLEKLQDNQKRTLASKADKTELDALKEDNQAKDQKIKDLEERLSRLEKILQSK